jgi:hypothetical protein
MIPPNDGGISLGQAVIANELLRKDDPGREFGMLRQPGHRFFFAPDEVEPLESIEATEKDE